MKVIVLIFEFHLKPALIQVMALHWTGYNPFPESFCQPHRMGHGQHLNLTWIYGTNVQKSALHMLSNSGNDSAKWHSLLALSAQTAFMKKNVATLCFEVSHMILHIWHPWLVINNIHLQMPFTVMGSDWAPVRTPWGRDKITSIVYQTIWNAFSLTKNHIFIWISL